MRDFFMAEAAGKALNGFTFDASYVPKNERKGMNL